MARKRSMLREIERDTYLTDRAMGAALAAQRGGAPAVAKRLVRRRVRRFVGRATKGWL